MISIASRDVFGGFTFAAFSAKNIPVAPMVMISSSLREPSMFFFSIKTSHLLYKVFLSSDQKIAGKNIKDTNYVDVNNAPCCPTPNVLRPKNITAAMEVTVVMSSPSPKVIGSLSAAAVVMDASSSFS